MKTIKVGTQEWMAENLNVSTFRNGDPIPEAKSVEEWKKAGEEGKPAWCYYGDDPENGKKYGKLYNWYAVKDPRGLAPEGWHVPTDAEWQTLVDYLGGGDVAGGKMKTIGLWDSPNTGATNESGFSALPGGTRFRTGIFGSIDYTAGFWSSTKKLWANAWMRLLSYDNAEVRRFQDNRRLGRSVRCVKD